MFGVGGWQSPAADDRAAECVARAGSRRVAALGPVGIETGSAMRRGNAADSVAERASEGTASELSVGVTKPIKIVELRYGTRKLFEGQG